MKRVLLLNTTSRGDRIQTTLGLDMEMVSVVLNRRQFFTGVKICGYLERTLFCDVCCVVPKLILGYTVVVVRFLAKYLERDILVKGKSFSGLSRRKFISFSAIRWELLTRFSLSILT
jgi:hypothetical protein